MDKGFHRSRCGNRRSTSDQRNTVQIAFRENTDTHIKSRFWWRENVLPSRPRPAVCSSAIKKVGTLEPDAPYVLAKSLVEVVVSKLEYPNLEEPLPNESECLQGLTNPSVWIIDTQLLYLR